MMLAWLINLWNDKCGSLQLGNSFNSGLMRFTSLFQSGEKRKETEGSSTTGSFWIPYDYRELRSGRNANNPYVPLNTLSHYTCADSDYVYMDLNILFFVCACKHHSPVYTNQDKPRVLRNLLPGKLWKNTDCCWLPTQGQPQPSDVSEETNMPWNCIISLTIIYNL